MIKQNRSLVRGLRILRVFNEQPQPSLADIAAAVGLDKTTCRRFLLTLQEEGYVEFDDALKRYELRPLVLELGNARLNSLSVPQLAAPYMRELANRVGGAVNLSVLDGDEIVLIGRAVADVEKRKLVTMNLHVGMRLPAHCTAMGRILIGSTHEDLRRFVAGMNLQKLAPSTVVSRGALVSEIAKAVKSGFSIVEDQLSLGYGAIAVLVRGARGERYGLAVSISTSDYSRERLERDVLPQLQEVRLKLDRVLAMRGGT